MEQKIDINYLDKLLNCYMNIVPEHRAHKNKNKPIETKVGNGCLIINHQF